MRFSTLHSGHTNFVLSQDDFRPSARLAVESFGVCIQPLSLAPYCSQTLLNQTQLTGRYSIVRNRARRTSQAKSNKSFMTSHCLYRRKRNAALVDLTASTDRGVLQSAAACWTQLFDSQSPISSPPSYPCIPPSSDCCLSPQADYEENPFSRRAAEFVPSPNLNNARWNALGSPSIEANYLTEAVMGSLPKAMTPSERTRMSSRLGMSPSLRDVKDLPEVRPPRGGDKLELCKVWRRLSGRAHFA